MAVVDDLDHPGMGAAPSREDFGRQPPQDLAAEQSVLGGMLMSKDAIADVLERLRPRCESKLRTIGRTYGHFRLTQTDTVDDIRS